MTLTLYIHRYIPVMETVIVSAFRVFCQGLRGESVGGRCGVQTAISHKVQVVSSTTVIMDGFIHSYNEPTRCVPSTGVTVKLAHNVVLGWGGKREWEDIWFSSVRW